MKMVRPSILLLLALILLSGCARTGIQRSERVQKSMQTVEGELQQSMAQIDATARSLENLIRPGQLDLKNAYQDYADNVTRMEQQSQQLLTNTEEMRTRRQEFFREWEKEGETYTNPQIRALSEQRRQELARIFAEIPETRIGVRSALDAYLSDIRSIQKYLSTDLTPTGVVNITPAANTAIRDGETLKETIGPLLSAISRARAELARSTQ
jgi:chromosome segregation ATPase